MVAGMVSRWSRRCASRRRWPATRVKRSPVGRRMTGLIKPTRAIELASDSTSVVSKGMRCRRSRSTVIRWIGIRVSFESVGVAGEAADGEGAGTEDADLEPVAGTDAGLGSEFVVQGDDGEVAFIASSHDPAEAGGHVAHV